MVNFIDTNKMLQEHEEYELFIKTQQLLMDSKYTKDNHYLPIEANDLETEQRKKNTKRKCFRNVSLGKVFHYFPVIALQLNKYKESINKLCQPLRHLASTIHRAILP
jgi:hypothetical protein